MCAHPLAESDLLAADVPTVDSLNSTVVFKNVKTRAGSSGLMECLICPECQTINHLGWLFCPQCGKKVDATFLQTMAPSDQAPTIWGTPPSNRGATESQTPVVATEDLAQARATMVNQEQPLRSSPPAQPPPLGQQQSPVKASADIQTQDPPAPGSSAGAKIAKADNSGVAVAKVSRTPSVGGGKGTTGCTDCGAANNSEYSFCLSCGASLPVTKTVVMASIGNPLKPRLRLLVEGKVSGPIHHINNELSIGRVDGSVTFPHDALMSSRHARIEKRGSDFMLIDETSSNGTFIRVKRETKLEPGDVILVGKQVFRFEA